MLSSEKFGNRPPALELIQAQPLGIEGWEQLLARVQGQNDPLSTRTLDVIVRGIREVAAVSDPPTLSRLSPVSQGMFVRLAKAYNSPTLLKEVGLVYQRELGLPGVAREHFERALRLGGPARELQPLIEEAGAALATHERPPVHREEPSYGGITVASPSRLFKPDGM